MEVRGKKYVTINIDKSTQREITEKILRETFDMKENYYLEKGNVVKWWEEGLGTHSWDRTEIVRKATPDDKLYFKFIEKFNKLIKNS
jgi:hypothetical protein